MNNIIKLFKPKNKIKDTFKHHRSSGKKLTPTDKILLEKRRRILKRSSKHNYLSDEDDLRLRHIDNKLRMSGAID